MTKALFGATTLELEARVANLRQLVADLGEQIDTLLAVQEDCQRRLTALERARAADDAPALQVPGVPDA